jgi:hypothetical protein
LILLLGGLGAGYALYKLALLGHIWFATAGYYGARGLLWNWVSLMTVVLPMLGMVLGFVALLRWRPRALRIYVVCWLMVIVQSISIIASSYARLKSIKNTLTDSTVEIDPAHQYLLLEIAAQSLLHVYFFTLVTLIFLARRNLLLASSV